MSGIIKIIKCEFKRIFSDKARVVTVALISLFFIGMVTAYFFSYPKPSGNYSATNENYEYALAKYEKEYSELTENSPNYENRAYDCRKNIAYYKFLIDEGKRKYDCLWIFNAEYYEFSYLDTLSPAHRGSFIAFSVYEYVFFPLLVLSFIIPVFLCVIPYRKGTIKNYFASALSRNAIFGGKIATAFISVFSVWFAVFLWGLGFALSDVVSAPFYNGGNYVKYNSVAVYAVKMLGVLSDMLFVAALAANIGSRIKSGVFTAFTLFIPLGICFFVFFYNSCYYNVSVFTPFVGVKYNGFYDYRLWLLYGGYAVMSALVVSEMYVLKRQCLK